MRLAPRTLLTVVFWAACLNGVYAQTVTNVRAAQRAGTKLVDVYYDLSGGSGPSTVAVAVSANGGASFNVSASSLSGAVGGGVGNGTNKHVVWNAGADWNGQFSEAVRFRITASATPTAPDGFVLIPTGSFTMGHTSGDTDTDAPPVSVYVSAFYMAKYEVTKTLWDEVRNWGASNGYTDLPTGGGKASNHPVQLVNWWDVVKWCNARSEKEGLISVYTVSGEVMRSGETEPTANWSVNGYRLPTEAEWEKAARGGVEGKRFPWGTDMISHAFSNYQVFSLDGTTNYYSYDAEPRPPATGTSYYHPSYNNGTTPYTSPVGSFASNGYSLYDMAGNVGEWCWDWHGTIVGASDPKGPSSGTFRMRRGGHWTTSAPACRAAERGAYGAPISRLNRIGFRPARSSVP